jgi:hypothetical protein
MIPRSLTAILQASKNCSEPEEITMPGFQSNFDQLKKSNVIPDVDENMLPKVVHDAIENLTDAEIAVLVNLSQKTGSHIYLNQNHQVICGF